MNTGTEWNTEENKEQTTQARLSYNLISFDFIKKKGHLSKDIYDKKMKEHKQYPSCKCY